MAVDPVKAKQVADAWVALKKNNNSVKNNFQNQYSQGGSFKEQLDRIAGNYHDQTEGENLEKTPPPAVKEVMEIPTQPELEKQVEGYVEQIEKEAELNKSVVDDYMQVLLGNSNPKNPKVKIPLNDEEIKKGMHYRVWEAMLWLAQWCIRQWQKMGQTGKAQQLDDRDWKKKVLG